MKRYAVWFISDEDHYLDCISIYTSVEQPEFILNQFIKDEGYHEDGTYFVCPCDGSELPIKYRVGVTKI